MKRNGTGHFHVTVKGSLNVDMKCSGEKFVDGETEYKSVYVRDYLVMYHKRYLANVEIENKVIQFFEGYKATYSDGYLFSSELGTLIWNADPIKCHDMFSILYQGSAKKLSSDSMPDMLYINEPKQGGQLFVELYETEILCDTYTVYKTGLEGITIYDRKSVHDLAPVPSKDKIDPLNMLITRFTQAKAGFVFRKLQIDLYTQYTSWFLSNCHLENKIMKTQIQQLLSNPEYASVNLVSDKKGIIAKKMGDVVYLKQCKRINVDLGVPKYCTNELPVQYNGTDYYLIPGSHILTK